jgi:hypothetical protein
MCEDEDSFKFGCLMATIIICVIVVCGTIQGIVVNVAQ